MQHYKNELNSVWTDTGTVTCRPPSPPIPRHWHFPPDYIKAWGTRPEPVADGTRLTRASCACLYTVSTNFPFPTLNWFASWNSVSTAPQPRCLWVEYFSSPVHTKFWYENIKERDHLERFRCMWDITLKLTLNRMGFIILRIRTSSGLLWTR
jgi:hypothetical protein